MGKFNQQKVGFTFVELLVVIVILAVLGACSLPVFFRAREKARQAVCASHLRQSSMAISLYTQDYDMLYPMFCYEDYVGAERSFVLYFDALLPYVRNGQIFICASSSPRILVSLNRFMHSFGYRYQGRLSHIAYTGNYAVIEKGDLSRVSRAVMPISEAEINLPSHTALLYDGKLSYRVDNSVVRHINSLVKNIHAGGVNVLFCDGHVKWVKLTEEMKRGGKFYRVAFLSGYAGSAELWGVVYQKEDGSYSRKVLR